VRASGSAGGAAGARGGVDQPEPHLDHGGVRRLGDFRLRRHRPRRARAGGRAAARRGHPHRWPVGAADRAAQGPGRGDLGNAAAARVDAAPSFYAVATTGPLYETISHTEDLRHGVSLGRALRFVDSGAGAADREAFLEAVVRLRQRNGLYVVAPGGVRLIEGVLFETSVNLPANIVEGVYSLRVYLTRDRRVIDAFDSEIVVRKEGLERVVYQLSREQPALYGVLAIAVALAAGLGASEAVRYLRR
jgi:hypothetical protein